MAKLPVPVAVRTDELGGVGSWTLEMLHNRYDLQPLTKENVHRAMADREALFSLMESRGHTDPKILEMCDYLMDIRHQFVRMILNEADEKEKSAKSLRNQVRNI